MENIDKDQREKLLIGSKISPEHCNDIETHLQRTLDRLKVDCIDLYMLHWPLNENSVKGPPDNYRKAADKLNLSGKTYADIKVSVPSAAETFKTLKKLQTDGKVKHIGVCNFGVK